METQNDLSNWDGFLGSNFLSAGDLKSEDDIFIVVKVELDTENGRPMLHLERNEQSFKFGLNVSNSTFCKDAGIKTPKDLLEKKILFKLSEAFSPTAKKIVPTLRIRSVK